MVPVTRNHQIYLTLRQNGIGPGTLGSVTTAYLTMGCVNHFVNHMGDDSSAL